MHFRDVQHQDRALSILRRSLASGRTHHAYLFDGPDGVGKERTALALAARLLCDGVDSPETFEPCGRCRACGLLTAGNHVDFHLIHRGLHKLHPDPSIRNSKGLTLAVDVIRHFLIQPSSNSPALGRARVFVIRDAERMNEGAQNALLKTLEEPPGSVRLVLVTSAANRLLTTIRSRCQRVEFDRLPRAFVQQQLAAAGVAADEANLLAELADGRLGAALRWHRMELLSVFPVIDQALATGAFDDPEAFAKTLVDAATELAERAAGADAESQDGASDADDSESPARRGKSATQKVDTYRLRDALKLVLLISATLLRHALIAPHTSGCADAPGKAMNARSIRALRSAHDEDHLLSAIESVRHIEYMLDRNVAPQLACERFATALSGDVPVL